MHANKKEILALGVFGPGPRLGERVAMLIESGRKFSVRVERNHVAVGAGVLLICLAAGSIAPRVIALAQDTLKFAAASIRPAAPQPPEDRSTGIFAGAGPQGGLRALQVSLDFLVSYAYSGDGPRIQVQGLPAWANQDRYDVVAAPEPGPNPPTKDQLREMTRNMLAERFKLQAHRETHETPVYALVAAKGGAKLRREWPQPPVDPQGTTCQADRKPMCTYVMQHAPVATLTRFLGREGKPVVDRTGLEGEFDIRMKFDRNNCGDESDCVSVRDAVQDQLGLKLEDAKAPVEVLVVDHAEKPDAD